MRIAEAVVALIGRRRAWRLGRALYMAARGESANAMAINGEALLAKALLAAAKAGDRPFVAFDVGANVGDWSRMVLDAAAALGQPVELHAFEPVPETFETLTHRLPPRADLHLNRLALSDTPGEAAMRVAAADLGTNSLLAPGERAGAGERVVTARLESAASYADARGVDHVDLLKIDAEGHDLSVVRGALPLVAAGRVDVVQLEYNSRWLPMGASLHALFAMVQDLPVCVARLRPQGLEVYEEWSQELDRFFEGNYALVRRDVLGRLPHVIGRFDGSNVYAPEAAEGR